ncbi:MAG: Threonine--tRNA ligase [Alphaproteobacteria bacterium MarineAlpha9_Bin4]|nr:MAG: Threonine--tRNA ligase [Alphaproteobacteria bacterium MarineAlpha9_Bin4]
MDNLENQKNILISFPDGKKKEFSKGIKGLEIAGNISKSLEKKSVAMKVNGEFKDLSDEINNDSKIEIVTIESEDGLEIMRHTLTAQVLAKAIKNLYPKSKLAIGPTIENGFYYDVLLEKPLSNEDLPKIEKEMKKIVQVGNKIKKSYVNKQEALKLFSEKGETYKVDIIKESKQENNFQIYFQENTNFFDLCYGPHLPNLKHVGSFKLTKVAGAYWKGDSKNEMLQRIYGTAWKNEDDLKKYLNILEEAEKRDHRKIGKKLELFHLQEEAVGSVFWHDKGWKIFLEIEAYIRKKLNAQGYKEVKTPQIIDRTLWEKSGHWTKFKENMFLAKGDDNKVLALKPMNCPGHVEIFKQGLKSYRDLPIRMAEFGSCHRNEPSGALHGIMRVRQFTQDDAHIFCTESQVTEESLKFCDLLREIYQDFGFQELKVKFSDRPKERAGTDQVWDKAEKALLKAVKEAKLKYELNPGEGAFYGPKLEFVLTDAIGRDWQCGTLQMDFVLPERLEATYIDENGQKKYPVMLHRAILGSLERWIGIIIEQYSGKFPIWLAPTQITICTITEKNCNYAKAIDKSLKDAGIRTELDNRNEKIGYKIREHSDKKVPIILVVGDKENSTESVSIRRLGNKDFEQMKFNEFIKFFRKELEIK